MRRLVASLIVVGLLVPVSVWATGFGGDSPPSRIPIPSRDFRATVEDHGGVVFEVDRASYNGEVFFYGTIGAAQVTLPFQKVTEVVFAKHDDPEKRTATAKTRDGDKLTFVVDDDVLCYGRTKVGNYSIETGDIRRIVILPDTGKPAQ